MAEVKKINLTGLSISKEKIACTGRQLSILLSAVKEVTESCSWYVADVVAPGQQIIEPFASGKKQVPLRIGSTSELIKFVSPISQFESGLFLAVESCLEGNIPWNPSEFDTEDLDYIEPSLLIIRAFDTSYFEVLSKQKNIIDRVTQKFGP